MGKKHPLDIFRTSSGGFDSASRDRRTLPGKVVTSTPRPGGSGTSAGAGADRPSRSAASDVARAETAAPLIAAARAAAAARAQERSDAARVHSTAAIAAMPSRGGPRAPARGSPRAATKPAESRGSGLPSTVNRILLYSALVVVAGFGLYLVGVNTGGTALKASSGVGATYTVVARTWDGSAAGKAAAQACGDALRSGGFSDVLVLGYPSAKAGEFKSYDLLVGSATSKDELATLVAQLGTLKTSKGEVAFGAARVVPTPTAVQR